MTPAFTFLVGLAVLVLFGWYFATDQGPRKRLLAMTLMQVLVVSSIVTIWPPQKKIALGLNIQGGTSFLIWLKGGDKEVTKGMLDQAVEVIRKRVDVFGVSEPIISPVANRRILVQIPGLDTAKIQEARDQLSRVAKLEFRLVYPDNGERLREIDQGKQVIPPEYRIETYKQQHLAEGEKPIQERLLIKKKADLAGDRVSNAGASYERDGWVVHLRFDSEGAKQFGNITAANVHHRFAIVLDGVIQSAPVIQDASYGGDAQITGKFTEEEARGLASVLENPLQTPVSIEEERSVSPTLGLDSIRASILAGWWTGHHACLRSHLLQNPRSRRKSRADHQSPFACRCADDVPLRPHIARHRGHHFDDWPFSGRERPYLRTIAGRNGPWEIAQGRAKHGLRQSFQLHFRCQRHDADRSAILFGRQAVQ